MKTLTVFLACLAIAAGIKAQSPVLDNLTVSVRVDTFMTLPTNYLAIAGTMIGGYAMTTDDVGNLSTDALILPVGSSEPVIFGGPRTDDVRILTQTPDGGYLITGSFMSWGQNAFVFQGQPLFQDDAWPTAEVQTFVIKTDKQMQYQWHRTFSSPAQEGGITLPVSALASGNACYIVVQTQIDWSWYPTVIKLNAADGLLLEKRILLQENITYPFEPTDTLSEGQPSSQWTIGMDTMSNGNLVIPFPGTDDGNPNMTDSRIVIVDKDSLTIVTDYPMGTMDQYDQFFDAAVLPGDFIVTAGVANDVSSMMSPRLRQESAFDSTFAIGHATYLRTIDSADSLVFVAGSSPRASNSYLYSGIQLNVRKGSLSTWITPFESADGYAVDLQWSMVFKDSTSYLWRAVGGYKSPGCYQDCDLVKGMVVEVRFMFPPSVADTTVIDTTVTPTVLHETPYVDAKVYPSPQAAHEPVLLETSSDAYLYTVTNLAGQICASGPIIGPRMALPTETLIPGTYLVTVETRKGRTTKHLVIQ